MKAFSSPSTQGIEFVFFLPGKYKNRAREEGRVVE